MDCKFELDSHVKIGVKGWLFLTTWSNTCNLDYWGKGLTSPESHHGPQFYLRSSSIEAGVSRKPFQVFENLGNTSQKEGRIQKRSAGQDFRDWWRKLTPSPGHGCAVNASMIRWPRYVHDLCRLEISRASVPGKEGEVENLVAKIFLITLALLSSCPGHQWQPERQTFDDQSLLYPTCGGNITGLAYVPPILPILLGKNCQNI